MMSRVLCGLLSSAGCVEHLEVVELANSTMTSDCRPDANSPDSRVHVLHQLIAPVSRKAAAARSLSVCKGGQGGAAPARFVGERLLGCVVVRNAKQDGEQDVIGNKRRASVGNKGKCDARDRYEPGYASDYHEDLDGQQQGKPGRERAC